MPNCRSISTEVWAHARESLVFYFSRRHGIEHAQDLAQDALTAFWSRPDFEFDDEEQFLRVCYGFASRISKQGYRKNEKHSHEELSPLHAEYVPHIGGLKATEIDIYLKEVVSVAKKKLTDAEWQAIGYGVREDRSRMVEDLHLKNANNARVHLYRARRKLAELTGWRKSGK